MTCQVLFKSYPWHLVYVAVSILSSALKSSLEAGPVISPACARSTVPCKGASLLLAGGW